MPKGDRQIYLLCYRADRADGHVLDDIIAAWTSLLERIGQQKTYAIMTLFTLTGSIVLKSLLGGGLLFPVISLIALIAFVFLLILDTTVTTEPYSHIEIAFDNGLSFSSASRGGFVGTRFKPIAELLRHPWRWEIFSLTVTQDQYDLFFTRAVAYEGRPYYFPGLFLDFCLPFGWLSWLLGGLLDMMYCSQVVYRVLTARRRRRSPRDFSRLIKNKPFRRISDNIYFKERFQCKTLRFNV